MSDKYEPIEKQFVTLEIARELKKLGFNEPCFGKYNPIKELISPMIHMLEYNSQVDYKGMTLIDAPLWQQAIEWLREKHKIYVTYSIRSVYCFDIDSENHSETIYGETYIKAQEKAILTTLKLIKQW